MKLQKFWIASALGLSLLSSDSSLGKGRIESMESSSYQEVSQLIRKLGKEHGVEDVLLVFDLDNTLLAVSQPLGSDQWFNWQYELLSTPALEPEQVAKDFDRLLKAQGILFSLSQMRPTDPQGPKILETLQKEGYPALVLTARGEVFRSATERVLRENGFDFTRKAPGPSGGIAGEFIPYDVKNPKASGLTEEEVKIWKLNEARPVTYSKGIYMTSGLHKGAMLRTLMKRLDLNPEAIVFVDDTQRNVDKMKEAFVGQDVELVNVRFNKEDPTIKAFDAAQKKRAAEQWKVLERILSRTFGEHP